MTEQSSEQQPTPAVRATWFFLIVQLVGLAGFLHELVISESQRPWILLMCGAMMLGGKGLELVVRSVVTMLRPPG